jgi:hypothetical protein
MNVNTTEDKQEEKEKEKQSSPAISDWMIALGVGAIVAGATAATIYYIKTTRNDELKALKYGEDEGLSAEDVFNAETRKPSLFTFENFKGYWRKAYSGFMRFTDLLKQHTNENGEPLVAANIAMQSPFMREDAQL